MPAQRAIQTVRVIQYDGTNSAEIIGIIGNDPTVSEVDGVWEVNDGMHDPMTVRAGDWHVGGYFMSAADFEANYVLTPEA